MLARVVRLSPGNVLGVYSCTVTPAPDAPPRLFHLTAAGIVYEFRRDDSAPVGLLDPSPHAIARRFAKLARHYVVTHPA